MPGRHGSSDEGSDEDIELSGEEEEDEDEEFSEMMRKAYPEGNGKAKSKGELKLRTTLEKSGTNERTQPAGGGRKSVMSCLIVKS